MLTVEFLVKEKLVSGFKIFGYRLRFVVFVTAQMSFYSQIASHSAKIIFPVSLFVHVADFCPEFF